MLTWTPVWLSDVDFDRKPSCIQSLQARSHCIPLCLCFFALLSFLALLLEAYLLSLSIILQFSCRVWIKSQFSTSCVDFYNTIWSFHLLLRKHTDAIYNQISGEWGTLLRFHFWPHRREELKMGLLEQNENVRCLKGIAKLRLQTIRWCHNGLLFIFALSV